ncbi:helix-turn-helix and ligand-binding sensor domain-containing protein [Zobellia uliginosa]|uniref:helix-turn-helix and ligand-binding sensor domain-containing protein n=1 Tax=Zobellia uliginosa TaxID=143224 RepID=UPI0026E48A9D|nr:triple tyrosine motif-containing protein [Zobellia uliginosa]MDO6517521.1 triple tyrosine motif-containing protein [Zobellia uliginosa]
MKYYILYLISFTYLCVCAQELPPIKNYTPQEYNGEYQNWGISQSSSKTIFIANHMNLLEFDGSTWHRYKLPNASIIRSVKAVDDRIYTGSYKEFGYWKKDNNGELQYTSLSDSLTVTMAEDEEFWKILPIDNSILFQSLDRIYIYDPTENTFKFIAAESQKARLNLVDNKVYFQIAKKGLFTIDGGKPLLVSNDPVFTTNTIIGVYKHLNNLMVITDEGRFYLYDFSKLHPWPTAMTHLNVKLYESLQLNDGSFVLGSIANGFYHLSSSGKLIQNITQAKGLNNNTVLSIFEDSDNNLWLGLDNGVSVINIYSPINEYADHLGNLGLVYAALSHNGHLYLGTNQGLFAKRTDSTDNFELIKGTEGQVWSLQLVHSTIFCGHNNGTFEVYEDSAKLISDFPGTWAIKPIAFDSELLLQGNYNGLSVLERKNGNWKLRNIIEGFNTSSRFFEIDSLQVIVDHEQKGLYKLELDQNLKQVVQMEQTPRKGHSSNIFKFKDRLYYKTNDAIYTVGHSLDDIVLDSTFTKLIFYKDEAPTSIIIPDTLNEKLWYFTRNGIKYVTPNTLTGKLGQKNIPMPKAIRSNFGVSGFENISHISNNEYLIGSSNGYLTLDLNKVSTSKHSVQINAINYGDYRDISNKANLTQEGEFDYAHNNLRFEFSVPEFNKYIDVQYQHKLKGQYNEWSEWSETPEVVYTNLPFGDYEFIVKAKIGNSLSKNVASYTFTIHRPWYASNSALLLYVLALVLLFVTIHRLYKRYYRKKQDTIIKRNKKELELQKLEEKDKIAQIVNEKLQSEIENKNRELAILTMSFLKKNKFLYALKEDLVNISEQKKAITPVIKKIDQNISSEDDWKFFEDAFNNADKDFLKRIKSKHKNLTNHDLRLCAYLRLNLSSKEIAPLLNISVKSVEMKRYRLRKKFDLPHQDNLIDYILNF